MFLLLIYYLPIWFQAVKGATAVKSGIMNLPMLLTLVLTSVIGGIGVTVMGYCNSPCLLLYFNMLTFFRCAFDDRLLSLVFYRGRTALYSHSGI
jgi:hypothetical protein